MKHRRTSRFKEAFKALPEEVKKQALQKFLLFEKNRSHPSLQIEKIEGYSGVWSGRITKKKYRWTFHFEDDSATGERICVHRVIGTHQDVYRDP